MEEFCAYCDDEVMGGGVRQDDHVFCSQECLDAFNEEALLDLEEDERDDI